MKRFIVHMDHYVKTADGYELIGRTDDEAIRLGDKFYGCEVVKLEAYGFELESFEPGLTGKITLKGTTLCLLLSE